MRSTQKTLKKDFFDKLATSKRKGLKLFILKQFNIYFAALMAATKFHFDGPKALPLEFARTLAGPGPAVRRGRITRTYRIRPAVGGRSSDVHGRPMR